jgi:hypothetical protein
MVRMGPVGIRRTVVWICERSKDFLWATNYLLLQSSCKGIHGSRVRGLVGACAFGVDAAIRKYQTGACSLSFFK